MSGMSASEVEVHDVARGLWLWRQPHWEWREGDDWEPKVSSFVVALPFEYVLVSHGDPVHGRAEFEAALDREPWSIPGSFS